MSSPAYQSSKTPVKNLQALLRHIGLSSTIESTIETLLAQVVHTLAQLIGIPSQTPASVVTAGAGTYSAANIATGIITRDCAGASRTDTTDTATAIVAALELTANYQTKFCTIVNTSDAAETITLAGGAGVTLKGSITCEQNTVIRLAIVRTSATTVCIRQA